MAYLLGKSGNSGAIVNYDNFYSKSEFKKLKSPLISIQNLTNTTHAMGTGTINNYGIFAGGTNDDYYVNNVTAYSDALIRLMPANLSIGRFHILSADLQVGVIFLGGYSINGVDPTLELYDQFLSKVVATTTYDGRAQGATGTIGEYAIFAGGVTTGGIKTSSVEVYSESMTRVNAPSLVEAKSSIGSAKVGNHVIFAGGELLNNGKSKMVEAYSSSLVKTILPNIEYGISGMKGASNGKYAVIAGGLNEYSNYETKTLVYDQSLTRVNAPSMLEARDSHTVNSLNGDIVFFGGKNINVLSTVEGIDEYLVRTIYPELSIKKVDLGSVKVGKYVIVAGGKNENNFNSNDTVDVYSSDFITYIPIPEGSKYKLNSNTEETANSTKILRFDAKVNGYVKYKSSTLSK